MALIKIELDYPLEDGMSLTFKAPCDCTAVTGLKVYYPEITDDVITTVNKSFLFRDTHLNALTNLGNLFLTGATVKVVVDTANSYAYIQNADTNGYIESRWTKKISISLPTASWVDNGNDIFTQKVTVAGGTAKSLVALQPTDEQMLLMYEDGVSFLKVDNDNGVFTAKAGIVAPTTDMTIQATLTEVSE